MKVRINVEREMVFDKTSVDAEYVDVMLGYRIPAEWCTVIHVDEPTEPGIYKLIGVGGYTSHYAKKRAVSGLWEVFGVETIYKWGQFAPVQEAILIERL